MSFAGGGALLALGNRRRPDGNYRNACDACLADERPQVDGWTYLQNEPYRATCQWCRQWAWANTMERKET